MGQLFLEHTTLSAGYFLEPNRAAAVIPPLAEEAFGDRPVRGIRKVDIDRNVPGGVDPISGPAIAGLFYTTKPDSWLPDLEEPLDWIIAQKTPESDLIIVEWHTTQKLGATTNICGPGTCARLTYDT